MKKVALLILAVMLALVSAISYAQTCDGVCTGGSNNSSTLDINDCVVRINDRVVKNDVTVLKAFERGQDLDIKIEFESSQDADDVQVMAFLTGYHRGAKLRDNIFDITPTFNVESSVSYEKELSLRLPDDFKISTGDELKIRIEISDKFSKSYVREYNLKVEASAHDIVIQDIILDPSGQVQAGRGVFANVRISNMGEDEEDSIKVTASIPALNLKATQYIDSLDADKATNTEDMFLRIPTCAQPGDYIVKVEVDYADGDEVVTKQSTLQITTGSDCQIGNIPSGSTTEKTVITVPGRQDVIIGTSGTVYPIIIQNTGSTDKSYQLTASGLDSWSTFRFDPGTYLLVKAGETQTAYLYVTPKTDAQVGEKVFMVTVETANEKKQISLTANVVAGQQQSPVSGLDLEKYKPALIIGLIFLIVLLIILGLIVGFNKMKGTDGESEEVTGGQTYY